MKSRRRIGVRYGRKYKCDILQSGTYVMPGERVIYLCKDFIEEEAELSLAHETIHIVLNDIGEIEASKRFDSALTRYKNRYNERIEDLSFRLVCDSKITE